MELNKLSGITLAVLSACLLSNPTFSAPSLGVHLGDHSLQQLNASAAQMQSIGMRTARLPSGWNDYVVYISENEPTVLNLEGLKDSIDALKSKGIKVILQFAQTPCHEADLDKVPGCEGKPTHFTLAPPKMRSDGSSAYGDFLAEVAAYLNRKNLLGQVIGWEVWNEVNVPYFWGINENDSDGNLLEVRATQVGSNLVKASREDFCTFGTPSIETKEGCEDNFVEEYLPLLKDARDSLYQAYADAGAGIPVVMATGMAGADVAYLGKMYELIGTSDFQGFPEDYFNAISIHPYTDQTSPYYKDKIYNSFEYGIDEVIELIKQSPNTQTPLYLTEFGWSDFAPTTPSEFTGTSGVSQDWAAYYLAQALDLASNKPEWGDRIKAMIWYELQDSLAGSDAGDEQIFYHQGLYAKTETGQADFNSPRSVVSVAWDYNDLWDANGNPLPPGVNPDDYLQQTSGVFSLKLRFPTAKPEQLVDAQGGATAAGTTVMTWTDYAGDNQKWDFRPLSNGYYQLAAQHTLGVVVGGRCLTGSPSAITIEDCASGSVPDNQQWWVSEFHAGAALRDKATNKCLTQAGENELSTLSLTACKKDLYSTRQLFELISYGDTNPSNPPPPTDGAFSIVNVKSQKLLDVPLINTENQDAEVLQWDSYGDDNQRWVLEWDDGDVNAYLIRVKHTLDEGRCLTQGTGSSNRITSGNCVLADGQRWVIAQYGNEFEFHLASAPSICMGISTESLEWNIELQTFVPLSDMANGAWLVSEACNASANQRFSIDGFNSGMPGFERVVLQNQEQGTVLGLSDNTNVGIQTADGGNAQLWEKRPLGNDEFQLVAMYSGQCLDLDTPLSDPGSNVVQSACSNASTQRWKKVCENWQNAFNNHCLSGLGNGNVVVWTCNAAYNDQKWLETLQ